MWGADLRDARRDRSAAHQAGAPDRTVGGDVIARVAAAAAQRRQGQARAGRPGEHDAGRAVHRTRLCDGDVRLVRIERDMTGDRPTAG